MQVQVHEARRDHRTVALVIQLDTRDATGFDRQRATAQLAFDEQPSGKNERRFLACVCHVACPRYTRHDEP